MIGKSAKILPNLRLENWSAILASNDGSDDKDVQK